MKHTGRGIQKLLLIFVVIAALAAVAIVGIGAQHKGSTKNIKLGLDLAGGVSITYEAVKEDVTAEEMSDAKAKLQKRAEDRSTESAVYLEGDRRIVVDIPGVDDANRVLQELGDVGNVYFIIGDGNVELTGKSASGFELLRTMDEIISDGDVVIEGSDIQSAQAGAQKSQNATSGTSYVVQLTLNEAGTAKFAKATEEQKGNIIAIIYDDEVVFAPTVNSAITGGEAIIEGMADFEEAQSLASTIRNGALPIELTEVRSNVVGARLGEEAIQTSLLAGAIGFILVCIFMIIFYRVPGVAASIALMMYVVMMSACLNGLNITLTLPGVAGILLSIGMAVDANVIIFTRIKEEIATGKTIASSMKLGFSKATSAIVDGNVTTLIVAAILFFAGSGTIKGFASTLALGIILSMFTALFVTRFILNALYDLNFSNEKYYGVQKERVAIPFVKHAKKFFLASSIVIAIGIVAMFVNRAAIGAIFNFGLDFEGGTSISISFDGEVPENDELVALVSGVISDSNVEPAPIVGENAVQIKTKSLTIAQRDAVTQAMVDTYGVNPEEITSETISPAVSGEMKQSAVLAIGLSVICMLIYIWIRFKDIRFGTSAVIALIHDVMVVIMVYAVARLSVGNTFIACVLTIVGYSINATIVIFDRIRENKAVMLNKDTMEDVVNNSITQSVSRSINTSITTFIMVFLIFIMGVDSIREFALPLMVGIVCGAYSSICIAGTLWYVLQKKFVKKNA